MIAKNLASLCFSLLFATAAYAQEAAPVAAQSVPAQPAQEQVVAPALNDGGAGDLLVAPTRVVLEGRARAGEVILSNKGGKEATYRVSLTHLRMKLDGSYDEITEADAKTAVNSADELVRFSPRQVTLKPGESQIVKVMMRKPEGLADGEYTSHLMFRAVPDLATGADVEAQKQSSDQISIKLIPIYGVSIPIIVRQGALAAQVQLQNPKRNGDNVEVSINRTGTKSVYGDITVLKGKEVVGEARGVAVMAYNPARNVTIPVKGAVAGPFTIEYRERADEGGKTMGTVTLP